MTSSRFLNIFPARSHFTLFRIATRALAGIGFPSHDHEGIKEQEKGCQRFVLFDLAEGLQHISYKSLMHSATSGSEKLFKADYIEWDQFIPAYCISQLRPRWLQAPSHRELHFRLSWR